MRDSPLTYFSGFAEGAVSTVRLPDSLFTELVPVIDDLLELQVTLLVFWKLAHIRAALAPWVTHAELLAEPALRAATDDAAALERALERAVARGSLLRCVWERADGEPETRYFANSPRGRAAVQALADGEDLARAAVGAPVNIFTLYEQNIGALSPLLSEELREAETAYPAAWIEEAFREAVRLNKRSWKYIQAILERWQTEGKDEIRGRDRKAPDWRSIEGDYADLIQH